MPEDKVRLSGMVFYGHHGVRQPEKDLGQRFVVNLEVTADLSRAGRSAALADTVNYWSCTASQASARGSRKDMLRRWPRRCVPACCEHPVRACASRSGSRGPDQG